ncbi:MAG TPA: M23 family metallopeptidase [Geobacteraceae bacterium]|nr:M23 family metallopeptidase [Geobacteraceae bacterium]
MQRIRLFIRKYFTPVTIMLVPHTRFRSFSVKVPVIGLYVMLFLSVVGGIFLVMASLQAAKYYQTKAKLAYVNSQYAEIKSTLSSLKESENRFRKLFSLESKKDVMDAMVVEDTGSVNMEALKKEIESSIKTVSEIREYLEEQKDVYLSTPIGWPVEGRITSGYGLRKHPILGRHMFHSGIDISTQTGSPVCATADGVVSYSGWESRGGNTVVIENGNGFRTAYAHNRRNAVNVGQRVKRGDVIAFVGSTGVASGPHVHYEVWKNGKSVDPSEYLRRWVD